ncbi:hypothetical protein ACIGZI_31940 [Streptomyces griseus]|uniref:hypothetical protein n=1 Tax=Streptomyces griseus TaxID=1911 RepID=UPI0037D9748A
MTSVLDRLEFEVFADLFALPQDLHVPPPGAAVEPDVSLAHVWIVAAETKVEERLAKLADFRGSFTIDQGTRADALEIYCQQCRRPPRSSPVA